MTDKEVTQEATAEEGVKATVETPPSMTIQDLQGLANIVDLASRRGAFQARDMEIVGALYNKLEGFLAYVAEQQKEATGADKNESDKTETGSEAPDA
jgi:hypothetical protein